MPSATQKRHVTTIGWTLLLSTCFVQLGCGGSAISPASGAAPTVSASQSSSGKTFSNLHVGPGWTGTALLPSGYAMCKSCSPNGPEATWHMTPQVSSPSISGNATQLDIGGQTPFADILWNNHLIGDFSSQNLPDKNRSLIPAMHNFTYDVYFYATNISASQAVEFDINQFVGGKSYIWGHECRIAGGNEWAIWDNQNQSWIPTGVACNAVNNSWNHVVIQVQRTAQNQLLYQSITLNGKQAVLNHVENPTSSTWYGVTINYQQDGNRLQEPYSIWLDKLNFSYW